MGAAFLFQMTQKRGQNRGQPIWVVFSIPFEPRAAMLPKWAARSPAARECPRRSDLRPIHRGETVRSVY